MSTWQLPAGRSPVSREIPWKVEARPKVVLVCMCVFLFVSLLLCFRVCLFFFLGGVFFDWVFFCFFDFCQMLVLFVGVVFSLVGANVSKVCGRNSVPAEQQVYIRVENCLQNVPQSAQRHKSLVFAVDTHGMPF